MKFNLDEDQVQGYKLKYPETWEVKYKQEGAIAHYIAPLDGSTDRFRENISLYMEDIKSIDNLEQIIENQINGLENSILEFNLIQKKKTKLSRREAFKLMFSGKKEGISFIFVQHYTLIDNILISLNFVAEKRSYDNYKNVLGKMIKNFQLISKH